MKSDSVVPSGYLERLPRSCLPYFEYKFLEDDVLRGGVRRTLDDLQTHGAIVRFGGASSGEFMVALQHAPYDSEIFGMNMWKVSQLFMTPKSTADATLTARLLTKEVMEVFREMKVDHLSLSLSTNLPHCTELFNAFSEAGFYYINTLLTFGCLSEEWKPPQEAPGSKDITIRPASPSDEEQLREICARSFEIDRFHGDPHLPKAGSDRIYEKAIRNAIKGVYADTLLVAECDHRVAGYYSARVERLAGADLRRGVAISAAVNREFRKRGVFRMLHRGLMDWFSRNADFSEMGTYLNNLAVHRVWTEDALRIVRCQHNLASCRGREVGA